MIIVSTIGVALIEHNLGEAISSVMEAYIFFTFSSAKIHKSLFNFA